MGHMGGLINPAQGADNTELVFQIPVGLPSLEIGCRVKKKVAAPIPGLLFKIWEPLNRLGISEIIKKYHIQCSSVFCFVEIQSLKIS